MLIYAPMNFMSTERKELNLGTYKQDSKLFDAFSDLTVTCKCGHRITLAGLDRKPCTHCGDYVYKDKKTEFKYNLKKRGVKCK